MMTPSEETICFYYEIGLALTQWAHVEDALRAITVAAFQNDLNRRAMGIGFFSLEGFRAKREFAEAIVTKHLSETRTAQIIHEWVDLVDRARRASQERNKLAHWNVQQYPASKPGRRYALEAWIQPVAKEQRRAKAKIARPRDGALCLRDIVKLKLEFAALTIALHNFLARAAIQKEPYPKSAEQPSNPPRIETLRRQMLEGFERLLRPSEPKQKIEEKSV